MQTNPRASALTKTLKAFQAVMLVMALVTMSSPVTSFTAFAQEVPPTEDQTVQAPEGDGEGQGDDQNQEDENSDENGSENSAARFSVEHHDNDDNDDEDDNEHKIDICHYAGNDAQVLNIDENGWNGHQNHAHDFKIDQAHPATGCVDLETETPNDDPYSDTTDDGQCVVVSNTLTNEGADAAVLVSNPHSAWTATFASIAKWIWGEDPTTLAAGDEVETFTRTFSLDDVSTGATLDIAADNSYTVTVNGNPVGADAGEFNYTSGGQDSYAIPAGNLLTGTNTLTFVVTNKDVSGETPSSNPAGLRYKLTVNGADCGEPKVVENSCLAPSAEGSTGEITVNNAPGSEDDLADLIDGSLDVQDDQVNFQTWDATGNDVDFLVTYHGKKANSGDKHLFGWFNGSTFTPVFRDAVTGNATYDALPLVNTEGDDVAFSVTGVTDISFGIYDVSSGKYYSTDKANSLNGDTSDHAVVYNPSADNYTIGFEDLPNGGDHDFEDVVVSLTTECSPTEDTITVVATKIVCDNESDLPNVMGSSHTTTSSTASDFMAARANSCHLEKDWQFEWANNGADGGNATTGNVAGYTASGLTAADGTVSMSIPLVGNDEIHLREVLKPGYIPFKGGTGDNVSAEFACADDGLNYDNWDFIRNPKEGKTYYCVAWNVQNEKAPTCDPEVNLLANGGFEAPNVSTGTYSIVPDSNPLLKWLVAWTGSPASGTLGLEIQDHVAGSPAAGDQHAELDGDHPVTISQQVATVPGQEYAIKFKYSPRAGRNAADNAITVKADGTVLGAALAEDGTANGNTVWADYTRTFTADSASTLIEFADTGTDTSYGGYLDDMSVTCVPDDQNPSSFKVHIRKYLDNGDGGSAQIPNESDAPLFPMKANYDIAGVGSNLGEGDSYNLGDGQDGLNDGFDYSATTIDLHAGDDYGTHEVTDGAPVIPADGQCVEGKYRLVGYKTGDTLEAAEDSEISTTAPFFTDLTDDKYVIVVNELCGDDNGGGDDTGTLVIVKNTVGGDDTFHFNIDEAHDFLSKVVAIFDGESVDVTTSEGSGQSEEITLPEGEYDVTESGKDGWTLQDVSCEYEGESEGQNIEGGEFIFIEAGETVTCTFTNTKDGVETNTENTIVVHPSGMDSWSLLNYDISDDSDDNSTTASGTTGAFVAGPATPPLQTGSFNQIVVNGDDATRLVSSAYNGTPLADITSLAYKTYVAANGGAQATYIQVRLDRDADGTWDDALFFEPVYQNGTYGMLYSQPNVPNQCGGNPNCVDLNTWQSWDGMVGGWWSNDDSAGGPPLTTIAEYVAQYPNTVLATDVPSIRIQAGFGAPVWSNFDGNFDQFVIGVHSGTNTNTTTYDFEPEQASTPNDNGGPRNRRNGSGGGNSGSGEVLGATTCAPLLTDYLKMGWANNPDQVMKLQDFLNKQVGSALPITGFFGPATFEAVKLFQKNYWEQVLKPWIGLPGSGIDGENTPTGFVYQTTRWEINNIWCPGSEAFPTTLN